MVRQTGPTAAALHFLAAALAAFLGVAELSRYQLSNGAERVFWIVVSIVLIAISLLLLRVAIWALRNDGKL
jgi:multidrug transporter EmrE-like cation transporter